MTASTNENSVCHEDQFTFKVDVEILTSIRIALDMFLLFVTTVLLYVIVTSGDVLNANCDLRGTFASQLAIYNKLNPGKDLKSYDPDLLFTCSNKPSSSGIYRIFHRTLPAGEFLTSIATLISVNLDDACHLFTGKGVKSSLFYLIVFELFLVSFLLYLVKAESLSVSRSFALLESGKITKMRLQRPCADMIEHSSIICIVGFLTLLITLLLGLTQSATDLCHWSAGVTFAFNVFYIYSAIFCSGGIYLSWSAYKKNTESKAALDALCDKLDPSGGIKAAYADLEKKDKKTQAQYAENALRNSSKDFLGGALNGPNVESACFSAETGTLTVHFRCASPGTPM